MMTPAVEFEGLDRKHLYENASETRPIWLTYCGVQVKKWVKYPSEYFEHQTGRPECPMCQEIWASKHGGEKFDWSIYHRTYHRTG